MFTLIHGIKLLNSENVIYSLKAYILVSKGTGIQTQVAMIISFANDNYILKELKT